MKVLKGYVRNRARPEGCIAECYLADECMQFCSRYVPQAADVGEKHNRNEDIVFQNVVEGHPTSAPTLKTISADMLHIAHMYILLNSALVEQYIK